MSEINNNNISEIETPFNFKLDEFQKRAIKAISKDESVLVCAKTGSGKTLVAEFQIYHSLKKCKRVIYTTPIKSLSNQKFYDLKKIYGEKNVGIITGDIKFQPQADILIMTTEILRNLLYKSNTSTNQYGLTAGVDLDGLDAVIFDEVHYINDPDRGKVWEETLILLPKDVNLVLLSATIGNAKELNEWLSYIKNIADIKGSTKNIHLIETEHRIVPLLYHTFDFDFNLIEISGTHIPYNEKAYIQWTKDKSAKLKEYDEHKQRVKNREEGQVISKDGLRLDSPVYMINQCIESLKQKELLPVLFFIFSRKDCEKYAKSIEQSLIDSSDSASVRHIIDFHLYPYKESLEKLEQYHSLRDLLLKGIAYHHSGLLPILKEIVEILFNKGFVKALFATETFAVGINMPTRTVVFLDYKKYDEQKQDLRIIRPDEFLQMAGRAGRRGIDSKGTVIYMPLRKSVSIEEHKSIVSGKILDIQSRMDFHYDFILKVIHSKKYNCNDIINLSYYNFNNSKYIQELQNKNNEHLEKMKSMKLEPYLKDLQCKKELDIMTKTKDVQRLISLWNNKHMGPIWNKANKDYIQYLELQKYIDKNNEEIENCKYKIKIFESNIQYLINFGFLESKKFSEPENSSEPKVLKLTDMGILATEINEANSLIMITLYKENYFNSLSLDEIAELIACFSDCKCSKTDVSFKIYQKLIDVQNNLKSKEFYQSNDKFWNISCDFIEPMSKWFKGDSSELICSQFDIFPGNFYRGIITCCSILDELITISEIDSNIELLEKLNDIKPKISRNIVLDSLYLKL